MVLNNPRQGADAAQNMFANNTDPALQPVHLSQLEQMPTSMSAQNQSLNLGPGLPDRRAQDALAHMQQYRHPRPHAQPAFQSHLAGSQYGMPVGAHHHHAQALPQYGQDTYQWQPAHMVNQGHPSPSGSALSSVDFFPPGPSPAMSSLAPMETASLHCQAQGSGIPCSAPPTAAHWDRASRENAAKRRNDRAAQSRGSPGASATSATPKTGPSEGSTTAAAAQPQSRQGPKSKEVSCSDVVRLRFNGYTRTGQACDRCKVSAPLSAMHWRRPWLTLGTGAKDQVRHGSRWLQVLRRRP